MEKISILILLSGSLCTGKSTLSDNLVKHLGFETIKSRSILKLITPKDVLSQYETIREALITYAIELDEKTNGSWLANSIDLESIMNKLIVFDSIRLNSQLKAFKVRFSLTTQIIHIHLKCTDKVLQERFVGRNENNRNNDGLSEHDFLKAKEHILELQSSELEPYADRIIITNDFTPEQVFKEVKQLLGMML